MPTVYSWPTTFQVARFELRVAANSVVFTSPYTQQTQALDLLGEHFVAVIDLTREGDPIRAAAREAFFDRLRGQVNLVALWNIRFPNPQGTLRDGVSGAAQWKTASATNATWQTNVPSAATWQYGGPVCYAAAQMANTLVIATSSGKTLLAGDCIGVGSQLFRAMADATADANGNLSVEVLPRVRTALPISSPVVTTKPTTNFRLKTADGVPVPYVDVFADSSSLELTEAF